MLKILLLIMIPQRTDHIREKVYVHKLKMYLHKLNHIGIFFKAYSSVTNRINQIFYLGYNPK